MIAYPTPRSMERVLCASVAPSGLPAHVVTGYARAHVKGTCEGGEGEQADCRAGLRGALCRLGDALGQCARRWHTSCTRGPRSSSGADDTLASTVGRTRATTGDHVHANRSKL